MSRGDYEAIAAAALRLIDDPPLAQRILHQARQECRKYSWEAVAGQWLSLYHALARQRADENNELTTAQDREAAVASDKTLI